MTNTPESVFKVEPCHVNYFVVYLGVLYNFLDNCDMLNTPIDSINVSFLGYWVEIFISYHEINGSLCFYLLLFVGLRINDQILWACKKANLLKPISHFK